MKKYLLVALLVLALAVPASAASFADVPANHWAYDAINKLVAEGVVEGYPDGDYKGDRTITRYEAAEMMAGLLEDMEEANEDLAMDLEEALADAQSGLSEEQAMQVQEIVNAVIAKNGSEDELSAAEAEEVAEKISELNMEFRNEIEDQLAGIESDVAELKAGQTNIKINGWGRAIFVPAVEDDAGDTVSDIGTSWDDPARIGMTISGESDAGNFGFQADVNVDGGDNFGTHDQQKIWVKPYENLTLEVGPNVWYQALRQDTTFGSFNWMRNPHMDDEDNVFARAEVSDGMIAHYDTEDYHVFGAWGTDEESADMISGGQYGVGYDMPGIGLLRAQYIGEYVNRGGVDKDVVNLGASLDYLMDDFTLDVGTYIGVGDLANDSFDAYGQYTGYDVWTFHGLVQTTMFNEDNYGAGNDETGFAVGFGADRPLYDGKYSLSMDLRYYDEAMVAGNGTKEYATDKKTDSVTAFAGVAKNFTNGKLGIGVQYSTTDFVRYGNSNNATDDEANWGIPIVAEYWF